MKNDDIIIDDEQTPDDVEILYPDDLKGFEVGIREDKFSVFEILRRYERGQIILDESFQRNFVWKKEQMSKFIESLLLDLPIPPLFFNQTIDNKYIIVDGRQRISTLISFLGKAKAEDNFEFLNFKLEGLNGLKYLNGKTYKNLEEYEGYQAKIEDKNFNIYIIKPSVKLPIIYDIFDRINTGGTKLNKQEVRNALRAGKATKLLKKLSQKDYFLRAIDNGISDERMKVQETVLRILCFLMFDYNKHYKGNMSDFLDNGMQEINTMPDENINNLEVKFKRLMVKSFEIFEKNNFRIISETRRTINLAVMDSVCNFIHTQSDEFIDNNKTKIRQNMEELLNNSIYIDAVSKSTGGEEKLKTRFSLAKAILSKI